MSEAKDKAVELGVRDAFDFWLAQHDISFPMLLEGVIRKVFEEWTDAHEDEIIAAIADRVSRKKEATPEDPEDPNEKRQND